MMHVVSQRRSNILNMYLRMLHFHLVLKKHIDIRSNSKLTWQYLVRS